MGEFQRAKDQLEDFYAINFDAYENIPVRARSPASLQSM